MKKTIAVAALLATALSFVSAKGAGVLAGVHGFFGEGWGSSWADDQSVSSSATNPFQNNMLYGGGAFVNIVLSGPVGIQPEVNFMVNNAGHYETSTLISTSVLTEKIEATTAFKYNSVDIPVFLTLNYNKFNFLVGPYISIPVSKLTKTVSGTTTTTTLGTTTKSDYNPDPTEYEISSTPIFGMAFGANVSERMGGMYLVFGARYMFDFTPVQYKVTSGSTTTYYDVYTRRGLTLDAGLKIVL